MVEDESDLLLGYFLCGAKAAAICGGQACLISQWLSAILIIFLLFVIINFQSASRHKMAF
jgi:hypothetical protein